MSAKYSDLEVALIEKHPSNPRHRAVADPELVESIKASGIIQPVIVAPIPDPHVENPKPGMGITLQRYVLIAGHRRVDGARKAKLRTVPAVIRDDLVTEGLQVEAMLIENGRREDLTPIEEAEGFAQLQLFGYKQKDIAKATGRDPKTVSARLRLLKLAKSTKDRVHKGQMTLENALAIADFADDPEVTKRLEKAATSTSDWTLKHEIDLAKQGRKHTQETAALAADLRARGIPEIVLTPEQEIEDVAPGAVSLYQTSLREPGDHDGCLRWRQDNPTHYSHGIRYYCADPKSHVDQLSEAERKRQEAAENARLEREKAAVEAQTAENVRAGTILDTVGLGSSMSPALRDVVRGLLPMLVASLSGTARAAYQAAMNVETDDRWSDVWGYQRNTMQGRRQATLLAQHLEDLDKLSDTVLARALASALVAAAESNLQDTNDRNDTLTLRYLDLLEQLGHEPCTIETALRDELNATGEERAS